MLFSICTKLPSTSPTPISGATPTTIPSPIPYTISAAGSVEQLWTGACPCEQHRTWQRKRPKTGLSKQSALWSAAVWAEIWTTAILWPAAATMQAAQCDDTSQPSQAFQEHELLPQFWVRRGRLTHQQYIPLPKAQPQLECNSREYTWLQQQGDSQNSVDLTGRGVR